MEDTIENIKEVKEHLKRIVKETNLHGKGEEDAKEIDFDFDRAIKSLEKQIPMKITDIHVDEYYCPKCGAELGCDNKKVQDKYCRECGQRFEVEDNV